MKSSDRHPRRLARQRGISLIETLVALGLFALSAATISSFMVRHIRGASTNNLYTKAYALAEDQLEATRALRYDEMQPGTSIVQNGAVTFTVATLIQNDTPANGLKKIQVDVSWNEPEGVKNVSVHTIYTEVRRY
jgi:Tfp pilus assembly protein PilV